MAARGIKPLPGSVETSQMPGFAAFARALAVGALCLSAPAGAGELHVYVDDRGVVHVTDDPSAVPDDASAPDDREALRGLWGDETTGPPLATPPGASGREADRQVRLLRDAIEDLGRGEPARAAAALRDVLRREPDRPEAHFYLAILEGRRGHLDSAEAHLRAFLSAAGDGMEPWRASAEQRLAHLDDERRLMAAPQAGELRLVDLAHPDFRIQADADLLASGSAQFAGKVGRYLDDARGLGQRLLATAPAEPMGVVLYGRASYVRTHGHRFSFQTVGFFDGRIHVVSAAHPAGELRTLLVHEYAHGLYRERTGSDRPFWLNEGLAEWLERASQGRPALSRAERGALREAIATGHWIPLRRIAPSFSGLDDTQARLAYGISTAAADWLERHTSPAERAQLLDRLGAGESDDAALRAVVGLDTAGLDAALRAEVRGHFPAASAPLQGAGRSGAGGAGSDDEGADGVSDAGVVDETRTAVPGPQP